MTSKKTLEYCAPEVKEIALCVEGSYLQTGSNLDRMTPKTPIDWEDDDE